QVLHALTFGPILFLIRDAMAGLVELNDTLIIQVADGCWDAIRNRTACKITDSLTDILLEH
ncbi:MAG: hypothetical protein GQ563_05675, partial [Desulfuromusa sp.]|nr:hypothetical protein [Desulfuromusa sp.]